MAFNYLTNLPLEKALEEYIGHLKLRGLAPQTECIPVTNACGRMTEVMVWKWFIPMAFAPSV